jgi:hypothetical protein
VLHNVVNVLLLLLIVQLVVELELLFQIVHVHHLISNKKICLVDHVNINVKNVSVMPGIVLNVMVLLSLDLIYLVIVTKDIMIMMF